MTKSKGTRGTKGLYKRGTVYWISYAGIDGKVIRETAKTSVFKDAEDLLIKRKQAVRDGNLPEVKRRIENHTFNELAIDYLKWAERQRAFEQKSLIIDQLKERFGHIQLRRFDTRLVESYQSERLQAGKKRLKSGEIVGNKPATINRHVATLKHIMTKAVEWEMVEEETLKRVRRAKMLEENNRRLRFLSVEESQALINACDKQLNHLKPIVTMALNTGMRKGEILSLTWDDVDLTHGFILLSRTKNGERREVSINTTLRSILEELFKGTAKRPRRIDVPYVFYDYPTGKPYANVHRSFVTACKNANIRDFHFHDLRHTFASHLVMAGIDITTVSSLLGHKDLKMTLRYSHLSPRHTAKALDILDQVLTNPTKNPTSHFVHKNEKAANA